MNPTQAIELLAPALALAYLTVCAAVAWRFTTVRRVVPAPGAAAAVRLASRTGPDGGRTALAAWYLRAPRPRGAVIFVHGKDACRGDELKSPTWTLAARLVASGLSVLMLDLRGHGDSAAARLTYGERERYDVLGAVDWLRARGHRRVGVLGASLGAAASLLAAADEPAIAALVADSAFADLGQMIERQFGKVSHLPRCVLPGALLLGRWWTGVDLRRVRPLAAAAALVGRPLLVIHGAGDRFIPCDDARAIAERAAAELWITPSHSHIGSYRDAPEAYADRVVGFFNAHLAAGEAAAPKAR